MKLNSIKILVFILILVFYGSFLAHKINLPAGDDLPRQMKIGETVLGGNFNVLYKNTYSYTETDQTFFNHHWLSGVVFYLIHQAVGWDGLIVFKIIIFLSAFTLIFLTALKKADFWLVAFFSFPTILILSGRTILRPELFSYLFIAIFLYLLIDLEEHPERNRIFWLIPLQLLWVNMHVFFSIGIMMVVGFLLEKIIFRSPRFLVKKLLILLVALAAVSFLNPRGAEGVFYHYTGANFPIVIIENQSLFEFLRMGSLFENTSVVFFLSMVFLMGLSFIFRFERKLLGSALGKPIFYFLAGIATAILGFVIIRGIALFGIVFLPIISANFNSIFIKVRDWLATKAPKMARATVRIFIFCLFVLFFFLIFWEWEALSRYKERGIGLVSHAESSAQFFKEQNLKGPIFNDADIGSYLIYFLYPQERVFMDNRFADAYSIFFTRDTYLKLMENEDSWQKMLQKYSFNAIFFYNYDDTPNARSFLRRRMNDSSWSLVYIDNFAVILVRNIPENQSIIKKFQITYNNISEKLNYLAESSNVEEAIAAADILNLIGRNDLAFNQYSKVTTRWPERGGAWMIMGQMALNNELMGPAIGVKFLERAIIEGQKTAEAYSFLGLGYAQMNQLEKAKEALRKSLKINPERQDARELLNSL